MSSKDIVVDILRSADITVGGERPWDIAVHNERVYDRILSGGTLASGESYMDGDWSSPKLDETMHRLHAAQVKDKIYRTPQAMIRLGIFSLLSRLTNRQSVARAFEVGRKHYDIGNELYRRMLDPYMQYSCGYWEQGAKTLAEAQEAKLDLIARKLKLQPGMRVLDIGCGWGGLAKFLSEKYKVSVTGITISVEQAAYVREWLKHHDITVEVADYRTFSAQPFDRIVSVGMFEHVGHKNYRTFMAHVSRLLRDDGLFLLHTIGRNIPMHASDPWIDTYIFPNGMLPSPEQISQSMQYMFVLEDWHNFGASYDKTLMVWYENFKKAWPELRSTGKYSDQFFRMWEYYLLSCAGAFRARIINLWQLVLTKKGLPGGYQSVR